MKKERILNNVIVDPDSQCWNWTKSVNSSGYGQLTVNKIYWTSHRYSYTIYKGPIEKGKVIRHSCHNTKCCNPEHLNIGSHKDNYHDSKEVYEEAQKKLRSIWIVEGNSYSTIREASKFTGITQSSLVKYTRDGVFDSKAYRDACKIAGWKPKI